MCVCVCVGGGGVVTVSHAKVLLFVYMKVFVHKFCKNNFCMTPAHQRKKKKKLLFLISALTAVQINRYVVCLKCVLLILTPDTCLNRTFVWIS